MARGKYTKKKLRWFMIRNLIQKSYGMKDILILTKDDFLTKEADIMDFLCIYDLHKEVEMHSIQRASKYFMGSIQTFSLTTSKAIVKQHANNWVIIQMPDFDYENFKFFQEEENRKKFNNLLDQMETFKI